MKPPWKKENAWLIAEAIAVIIQAACALIDLFR